MERVKDQPLRLYQSQVAGFLSNRSGNPNAPEMASVTTLQILSDSPAANIAAWKTAAIAAKNAGYRVIPGFRLMETNPSPGWMDAARWARNVDFLGAMLAAFPLQPGDDFAFDAEAYFPSAPAPSQADQAAAMAPFLAAIVQSGIRPCVYPADIKDQSTSWPIFAIADAVGGDIEFWTEHTFAMVASAYLGADANYSHVQAAFAAARVRETLRARWPACRVRQGSRDSLLRVWGAPMRSSLIDFGELGPWVFDYSRGIGPDGKKDNTKIGRADWITGMSLSPTNDPKYVWQLDKYQRENMLSCPGDLALTFPRLPGVVYPGPPDARPDLRSDLGFRAVAGYHGLVSGALPSSVTSWTIACQVVLPPVGAGVLVGACFSNTESWQVVLDDDGKIRLEIKQGAPVNKITRVMMDAPARGVPLRLIVAYDGNGSTGKFYIQDDADGTPVTGVSGPASGQNLYLASGTTIGTKVIRFFEGVVYQGLELSHRVTSATERAAIRIKAYPRGVS